MPAPRFGNWLRCTIQLRADSGVLVLVIDVVADIVGAVVIDEDTAIEVVGAIAVEEYAPVDRNTCGRTATSFLCRGRKTNASRRGRNASAEVFGSGESR